MSVHTEFQHLLEDIRVFHRNLGKENVVRRTNFLNITRKLKKVDNFAERLETLRRDFNQESHVAEIIAKAKSHVENIDKLILDCRNILEARLEDSNREDTEINSETSGSNSDSEQVSNQGKMSEKFDLKTAATLLPLMNGSENVTKQLIDAIDLYNDLLDADGKKLLITYVLKTRLSQSAKIRLKQQYATVEALVTDLKGNLLTQKSPAAISVRLHNARQNDKTVENFGKTIEQLFVDLTLAQSQNNTAAFTVLQAANEKIAINSFANGLRSAELRTIVKSRNYTNLNDAIRGAKDEESQTQHTAKVFSMQNRGSKRGFHNNTNPRGKFFSHNTNRNFSNSNNYTRGFANNSFSHNRHGSRFTTFRGQSNNFRGNFNNRQNNSRVNMLYPGQEDNAFHITNSSARNMMQQLPANKNADKFFRD